MRRLADKYGKTIGQICLRWCLQKGFVSLPKSANPMRIKENSEIFDLELTDEDIDLISNLKGFVTDIPKPDEILF